MEKKIWLLCGWMLLLSACGREKEAKAGLERARVLYEERQFAAAKNAIDTLRMRYPEEVAVLKESLTLMRLVERGESERNIAFCDSMIPIRAEEAEAMKKNFVLEKDTVYEDVGHYVWKQKTVERNVERSYIRCGVDEKGEIYLASVFFGRAPLNHTGLKFCTPDGAYAETASVPYDGGVNYRFKDLGNTTEIVTYKAENGIDAIKFICELDDKARVKAEYTGGKPFSLMLSNDDKKAIRATFELAVILSDLEKMRREKEKSMKKITYIDQKLGSGEMLKKN